MPSAHASRSSLPRGQGASLPPTAKAVSDVVRHRFTAVLADALFKPSPLFWSAAQLDGSGTPVPSESELDRAMDALAQ